MFFVILSSDGYETDNEDGVLTNVDEPEDYVYDPKIPQSKVDLKHDGEVVDTNFLAWLATMKDANVGKR